MSDWRPSATWAALQERARVFAQLRSFFADRGVMEVDTPLIARFGVTDPSLEPLRVCEGATGAEPAFLQTSPEFAMKRLLAAGSGPIYQLGKAFRGGNERGARHNPEFTLLEWYRPGFDLDALIEEVAALVSSVLGGRDWEVLSYAEAFQLALQLDPFDSDTPLIESAARAQLDLGEIDLDRDGWLDLLMSHCVEPMLAKRGMVFMRDYPPSQAVLAACVERGGRVVAQRFELYVDGMELANGYLELRDADELRRRARLDNQQRERRGRAQRELDKRLVAALEAGLPECSGVALGVDRLLMLRLGETQLSRVVPFDWSRA